MALYDFVKSLTKSSLLAHLKNIDQKTMKWRKDLLDAVVTKDELEEWSGGGGVDHGALTGLGDDDHTQYLLANGTRALSAAWDAGNFEIRSSTFESDVATGTAPFTIASTTVSTNLNADKVDGKDETAFSLADGTRAFTGVVSGVDPTVSSHLATKEYVDQVVGIRADYYFTDTAADIGGIYYYQTEANPGGAGTTLSSAALGTGDGQAVVNFITEAGHPGTIVFKAGVYHAHVHAEKAVVVGTKPVKLYFEIYKRILAGTETLIATSELSGYITTLDDIDLHAAILADVDVLVTDRIVIKWLANVEATGGDATVNLYLEGTYASRLEVPVNTEILSSVFVRRDGTTALSADWDAGSFEIRAQTLESDVATGTSPLTIASTTKVDNLNVDFLDDLTSDDFVQFEGTSPANGNFPTIYTGLGTPPYKIQDSGYSPDEFVPSLLNSSAITMTVYNDTGAQIDALKVCYISGDNAGTPLIVLADADAEATASQMLVVVNANIADAASGIATVYGWVGGLSGLTAGAIQYLSTTDGGITETAPSGAGDVVRTVGYAMSTTEMFFCPDALSPDKADAVHTHVEADITDLDHTDATAIHDNVDNEIAVLAEKTTPVGPDFLLIEDSEDSNAKKFINISNLPFGVTTGSGVNVDIYFEDPPYTSGNDLTVEGEWTNIAPYTQYWSSSLQTPPSEGDQGCALKNTTSSSGARARYDTTQWTSGVVDCYYRVHANVNQICSIWFGDSTVATNGIHFGLVTAAGGDTTGFQYASYGTPETYHAHFGTTNGTTAYWIRAYIDMDNGLGKMKGWSGAIGDEPAPWGVERTFTGAIPNPLYMILHVGTTSNASSFAKIWEIHVTNDYVIPGTLGNLDHGALEGLDDDDHQQYLLASGTRGLSADWDAGTFEIRANTFESDVATGTIPLVIASTTACTNLNADLLDGVHAASLLSSTLDTGAISMTVKNSTGVNIAIRSLCYISGDSSGTPLITLADADAEASCSKMLVMTAAQINNGASGLAIIYGWVTGFSSLTAGAIQYASTTDGGIAEAAPSGSGDIVRIVGYAMSATEIFFNPDQDWVEVA